MTQDEMRVKLSVLRAADVPRSGRVKVVRDRDQVGFDVRRLPAKFANRYAISSIFWTTDKFATDMSEVRNIIDAAA